MTLRTRIDKYRAAKIIYRSIDSLKRYRREGILIEGLHYQVRNSRCIEYFEEALIAWVHLFNYDSERQLQAKKLGFVYELTNSGAKSGKDTIYGLPIAN
jgi:hypothetical protein